MSTAHAPRGQMIAVGGIDAYHIGAQGARKGGLVLVQEIFGVTDHIKRTCDQFAGAGFEVLAPSLYDREEKHFTAAYDPAGLEKAMGTAQKTGIEAPMSDIQACIDRLAQAGGPVFITGYCYGGSVTWLAACRCSGLAAASGFYGGLIANYAGETPRAPVILHFGEKDALIPMDDVRKVEAAHKDVPVYVYDADHGFCSDRPANYDAAACGLARRRTLDLFAKHGGK